MPLHPYIHGPVNGLRIGDGPPALCDPTRPGKSLRVELSFRLEPILIGSIFGNLGASRHDKSALLELPLYHIILILPMVLLR